jgi:hypothetical protein
MKVYNLYDLYIVGDSMVSTDDGRYDDNWVSLEEQELFTLP